jgi:hypothetical protein
MLDQIAIFLILFVLWIGLRYWGALWIWRRVNRGQFSYDVGQALHAGIYAVLPLLGLPWVRTATDVAILVGLGILLFVFQFMLGRLYRWFIGRNS